MYFQYETEHLILRVLDDDMAEQVQSFYIEGDPYFSQVEAERPEEFYSFDYQQKLLRLEREQFLRDNRARYYLFEKDNLEKVIGTVAVFDAKKEPFDKMTIGYKLLPQYTGKGYATEAVRRVTEAVFFDGHFHRVEAYVQPSNAASIRVLEKVGFERECLARSVIKLRGKWLDHYRYVCINGEDND